MGGTMAAHTMEAENQRGSMVEVHTENGYHRVAEWWETRSSSSLFDSLLENGMHSMMLPASLEFWVDLVPGPQGESGASDTVRSVTYWKSGNAEGVGTSGG